MFSFAFLYRIVAGLSTKTTGFYVTFVLGGYYSVGKSA